MRSPARLGLLPRNGASPSVPHDTAEVRRDAAQLVHSAIALAVSHTVLRGAHLAQLIRFADG